MQLLMSLRMLRKLGPLWARVVNISWHRSTTGGSALRGHVFREN